jgi:hypothetical protein
MIPISRIPALFFLSNCTIMYLADGSVEGSCWAPAEPQFRLPVVELLLPLIERVPRLDDMLPDTRQREQLPDTRQREQDISRVLLTGYRASIVRPPFSAMEIIMNKQRSRVVYTAISNLIGCWNIVR